MGSQPTFGTSKPTILHLTVSSKEGRSLSLSILIPKRNRNLQVSGRISEVVHRKERGFEVAQYENEEQLVFAFITFVVRLPIS